MHKHTLDLRLDRDTQAPGRARRAISEWLAPLECGGDVTDRVLLVVSELVTNAVVHARSAPEVTATFDNGRLLVAVADTDPVPSILRTGLDGDTAGGFGLRLVAALTDSWGWEPTEAGKRVWTETSC